MCIMPEATSNVRKLFTSAFAMSYSEVLIDEGAESHYSRMKSAGPY